MIDAIEAEIHHVIPALVGGIRPKFHFARFPVDAFNHRHAILANVTRHALEQASIRVRVGNVGRLREGGNVAIRVLLQQPS